MKRVLYGAAALLSISLIGAACKKSDNPTCTAGPGGNTEVVVFALHNSDTIIHSAQQPDTAFVAWSDAGDPPNPNFYDTAYIAEAGEDHVHLANLKCGNYRVTLSVFDTVSGKRYTGNNTVSFTRTSGEVVTAVNVN